MSHFLKPSCVTRFFSILSVLELCLLLSACASVDTILLTSKTFPPKGSADEVAVLEEKPTRPHRELAELRIGDSWLSFGSLQRKILNRAAALGADAVVFAKPQTLTQHELQQSVLWNSVGVWWVWRLWRSFWIVGSMGWRLLPQHRGSVR